MIGRRLCACLFLLLGCSVGESTDPGLVGPWGLSKDKDDAGDDDDDREGATGDEEPGQTSTSGPDGDGSDTISLPDDSGDESGASTGEDPEMGESSSGTFGDTVGEDDDGGDGQPASGPWSACPVDGMCGSGLNCIVSELIVASLCVESCMPAGDPSSCSPPPGGDSTPACLPVGSNSYCVLDCSAGQTCPNGMVCHDEDGTSLCL